ncbi:hypothetical protein KTAU_24760 [Thermogemmatispora aurantia]|uniref:Uncharacterized protein n=1 Tax=Thermogemmatispora aurantia TaxID=2045279 RepID=A0A5J4KAS2_9CHLR|nr:hypothetical protein KTAU_24760 [Thermogemmatispora aurantia]
MLREVQPTPRSPELFLYYCKHQGQPAKGALPAVTGSGPAHAHKEQPDRGVASDPPPAYRASACDNAQG